MLIGIDGNEANVSQRVGVGEYAFQVLTHLKNQKPKTKDQKFHIYLKEKPLWDLPEETDWWKYKVFGPKKFWTQFALPLKLYLERPRPNVFFTPSHYAPRFCPCPSVISIMDLAFFKFPDYFRKQDLAQLKSWTAYSLRKAAKALTISEATKNDIIRYYKVLKEKIVVTYPGYDREKFEIRNSHSEGILQSKQFEIRKLKAKYNVQGEFILYLGTLQPRKNLIRLIEAFGMILRYKDTKILSEKKKSPRIPVSQHPNISLVIAGKKGWLYDEIFRKVKDLGLEKKVIFTGFVPEEEKPFFYQAASVFVLPSLYEGFGIPVLEAMACGCPVVCSNTSSLPEVGGKAAVYVDPYNVDEITQGILEVLRDDAMAHHSRVEEGLRQAKKFSWEKCARETLEVLEEVAKLKS